MAKNSTTATKNLPEYSVSELSHLLKRTVEDSFSHVRVRGEISGFKQAASGHLYMTLKDESALIDGVCWRGISGRLSIRPEDGLEVIATGKLTTYPARSKYQIVIEAMEAAGEGALLKVLEARRKKLAQEGLFNEENKQSLPFLPDTIGIITSPTGAVIRDILHRFSERFPRHVLLWPVLVQGEDAADQITSAIQGFNTLPDNNKIARPDVIIVARGGGSLEDLWAFNEENVVRAAATSNIPLISAIGHETDWTLIDYASDQRAPTPTAAAEIAVPVRSDLLTQVLSHSRRMIDGCSRLLQEQLLRLKGLERGLTDPISSIRLHEQRLDELGDRLQNALRIGNNIRWQQMENSMVRLHNPYQLLRDANERLLRENKALYIAWAHFYHSAQEHEKKVRERLSPITILRQIRESKTTLLYLDKRGTAVMKQCLKESQNRLQHDINLLESYSFERVLERGYAVIIDETGSPIMGSSEVFSNEVISIQFSDGRINAVVTKSDAKPKSPNRIKLRNTDKRQRRLL